MANTRAFQPARTKKELYRRFPSLALPLLSLEDVIPDLSSNSNYNLYDKSDSLSPTDTQIGSDNQSHKSDSLFLGGTDGVYLYWPVRFFERQDFPSLSDPPASLNFRPAVSDRDTAAASPAEPLLFLLHELLHCILGHSFRKPADCPAEEWNRRCDEQAARFLSVLVPELFPDGSVLPPDSHEAWPIYAAGSGSAKRARASGDGEAPDGNESGPAPRKSRDEAHDTNRPSSFSKQEASWAMLRKSLTGRGALLSYDRLSRSLAAQKQFGRTQRSGNGRPSMGRNPGTGKRRLTLTDARRGNYRKLLKDLSCWGEDFRLSSREFYYPSYLYGLEHYDGLPLIEPLESEEAKKIRELAIVIDTSGSCSRTLTQAFLEETRALMEEEDLFFHPFNLHILQCDTDVRRDDKITSPEDWHTYIDSLEICGMGGTDFRPAFSHIKALIQNREFSHLSGILYFTDGLGIYPEKDPEIPTTFIFLNHRYDDIDVPGWAKTLILPAEPPKGADYEY